MNSILKLMSLVGNANANAFLGKLYTEGGSEIKKDYVLALKYYKVRVLHLFLLCNLVICCYQRISTTFNINLYKLSVGHLY